MDSLNVLQADYYDTYDYRSYLPGFVSSLDYIADENYGKLYVDNSEVPLHCKGLLTGSMTTTLGVDRKLYGCYYYDFNRNLIQERHTMLNGEIASYRYSYDFSGQPVKSAESYGSEIEFKRVYSYDHLGRLLEEKHVLKNDTTRFVYDYDALGRVKSLVRIHDKDSLSTENEYNIRNWLTAIRNPHFTQELHYTDGAGMPRYNGNISSMNWKDSNSSALSGYKFTYDDLNRMTDALYGEGSNLAINPDRFNEQVTGYDKMGNIIGLKRSGQLSSDNYGWIDNLAINYDGNQLKKVVDNAAGSSTGNGFDFKDGANEEIEYVYDSNGNLIKDLNKKIADIQYNVLNLPRQIVFEDGNSIYYLYDVNGVKLRAIHIMGNDTVTTDYCGSVIYENGVAEKLLTGYGYISLNDNEYHHFIQDHQGNNRVIVDQEGKVEEVNHYYPFGGLMANSTGCVQMYKFNGKELDRKEGLDWYDYGARMYDAVLGRWHTVDPLNEKYYGITPYSYCGNNPVNYIDPFGMDYWSTNNLDEIARFMDALRFNNNSILESFNFDSWNHATDSEFTGNLTFNDETNTFYSSYGTVENGEATRVGISIKASNVWKGGASIDGGKGRWYKKASGRMENTYPEFNLFFGSTKTGWNIVKCMFSSMFRPFSTINTFNANRSGFVVNGESKNIKKISDKLLKQKGINAHDIKYEVLGKKAPISQYDLYKNTRTDEILILRKGGKGEAIPTGIYLE